MTVLSYLDVSTAYLPRDEARLLESGVPGVICYPYEFGFFVPVVDGEPPAMLPHLAALLDEARSRGCLLVRIDADGPVDLPDRFLVFDW